MKRRSPAMREYSGPDHNILSGPGCRYVTATLAETGPFMHWTLVMQAVSRLESAFFRFMGISA